jgi:hypothetical protein
MTDLPTPAAGATHARGALLPSPAPTAAGRLMDRLVAIAFVFVLLLPASAMAAGLLPPSIENRPIRPFPELRPESMLETSWYVAVDQALTDRLVLRPAAVRLRANLSYLLGGTGTTRVVRGDGDWLFYGLDFHATCKVSASEYLASLDALVGQFRAHGQQLRVMIAPDKSSIYPDRFRGARAPSGCTARNRAPVRAGLADRPDVTVDAWELLDEARAAAPTGPPLYFEQDTHWTPDGAAVAIAPLIGTLDTNLWDPARVTFGDRFDADMDLARIIGLDATEPSHRILPRPAMTVSRVDPAATDPTDPTAVFELRSTGPDRVVPGRTLVIYDSFFYDPQRPYVGPDMVAPFFAESVWIRIDVLLAHPELGAQFGPYDTVIFERVERAAYDVPLETFLSPLVRTSG